MSTVIIAAYIACMGTITLFVLAAWFLCVALLIGMVKEITQ